MAHNVTRGALVCAGTTATGVTTASSTCSRCRLRFFYNPTPYEGTVRLLCIECALGLKACDEPKLER